MGLFSDLGGGGGKAGSRMGSDCDHEGSLATWLWSSVDDQIYLSLICIQGHALGEPWRTRFPLSGTGDCWPWFPLWSPGRGQRKA